MKKKLMLITVMMLVIATGLLMFTGCGSTKGQNLEDYMKGQPALRNSVDARLSILSADAKGSVKYREDNTAEVTVQYYSMSDEEIAALEPDKAEIRSKSILKPVVERFAEDTGNEAKVVVIVEGHTTE